MTFIILLYLATGVGLIDLGVSDTKKAGAQVAAEHSEQPSALPSPLQFPTDFMDNIQTKYGAKGNGIDDDTAAIQTALNENRRDASGHYLYSSPQDTNGRPKALYFPAGTYLVSNKLDWAGCCVTLQGQGSGVSVIKLKDGAAGFGDNANPKPVIQTEQSNEAFRHYIWNLGVNTGSNNPGAMGIDFIASNSGSLVDVQIKSGDGQGYVGLGMDRNWPGPLLVKNVAIDGFDYGIRVSAGEYSQTYENITLTNQRRAGVRDYYGTLVMRNLKSVNSVPVLQGDHPVGMVTILDGDFKGGDPSVSALQTLGSVYLRNVQAQGYQSLLKSNGTVIPGLSQTEYATNRYELFSGSKNLGSLKLPIKETPEYHDNNLANWARFTTPNGYGDTSQLQAVLNSGKPTVYFPWGIYYSFNERVVNVPASVKRIVGYSAVINTDSRGTNGGGIKFVVQDASPDPLIIEGFGYGVKIEYKSSRPLAIKYGAYTFTDGPGANELFLEDVIIAPLNLNYTKKVWARQFNPDTIGAPVPKVYNQSAALWILGIKTENKGTLIKTTNGAYTELLGGMVLANEALADAEKVKPIFSCVEARCSLIYRYSSYPPPNQTFATQIQETRNGQQRQFQTDQIAREVTLFSGYSAPVASATPSPSTTLSFSAKQGQTAPAKSIVIKNNGNTAYGGLLTLGTPVLSGSGAGAFNLSPAQSATVEAAGSSTYSVTCTPPAATNFGATLTFATNDPAQPSLSYNLSCAGLPLLPTFLAGPSPGTTLNLFGVTGSALAQSINITNIGDPGSNLAVGVPQLTGPDAAQFSITPTASFGLAKDASQQVGVNCTAPSTAGQTYTATLTYTTNDPNQPQVSYQLSCKGLSQVVVVKKTDDGSGSVAQSLSAALKNYVPGQIITFQLEDNATTIMLSNALPPIGSGVYVDGGTCGTTPITLDGSPSGVTSVGLEISGKGVTSRNLNVQNFGRRQIETKHGGNATFYCTKAKSR